MKKQTILKLLILAMTATCCGIEAFADTSAELVFRTSIPRAASIKLLSSRSIPSASPTTGIIDGTLCAVFELDSNDTDGGPDFVITAEAAHSSGNFNAYDGEGNILFTNETQLPSSTDVAEAFSRTGDNYNAILYPVTIDSPFTINFQASHVTYGNCYIVNLGGETEGTITHTVGPSPVAGTFSTTKDTAGTYKATVTITAIST